METTGRTGKGLWNCPKISKYSNETQEMVKLMMEESKLTNFQRRQINKCLNNATALPVTCNPSSSAPTPQHKQKRMKPEQKGASTNPKRRSEEKCRSGDNYSREMFRPGPTRDLEKEKKRLQNILATGKEEPTPRSSHKLPAGQSPDVVERDRFQEVLEEIEERKHFLSDMTALGQGKIYHNLINTEISQKIHELELIDKARSQMMREMLPENRSTDGK